MGVINVTPDSFSDGGKFLSPKNAKRQAISLIKAGADILDIGGESSRPFSEPITAKEELHRVIPVVKEIRKFSDCPLSIDTVKAEVAEAAINEGADIINDISAMRFDSKMVDVASAFKVPVILMHMKGTPKDMQLDTYYKDVVAEVKHFLKKQIEWAINKGIVKENIIIDPGIGFGKTFQDNLVLLNRLNKFTDLGVPIMVGVSRKAFIGKIVGLSEAEKRDVATSGATAASVMRGADLVRVHNVALTRQVLIVVDAIRKESL
jgi:dihydropteroate synthase